MNWNLIMWFAGVMATLAGLKFVIVLFRSLVNKDSMKSAISVIGDKIHEGAESVTDYIKTKAEERKVKKELEERPIIRLR